MNPEISVIVPIFKVEKYLRKCIDSILYQTFTNFELILVDDGSPDNCGKICDNYASKDNRIKVIHKENGGLSSARNAGLDIAKGAYISFIDSDDYINIDTYEKLYLEATNNDLDIVAANARVIRSEHDIYPIMKNKNLSNEIQTGIEYMSESIQQNSFMACVWLNLYRKDLLLKNELYFKEGIYHEDEQWTPRVFLKAKRVKYINFQFYNYIIRDDSITKKKRSLKNNSDIIEICYELEKFYSNISNPKQRKIMNSYLFNMFLKAVFRGELYKKENKQLLRKSFLIGKSNNIKDLIKTVVFVFNIDLYIKILSYKVKD